MFPDTPDPTPESILPSKCHKSTETTSKSRSITEPEVSADCKEIDKLNTIDKEDKEYKEYKEYKKDKEDIGVVGVRFCYEIVDCPNPSCVVRRRQIIQCFKFFSRKYSEKKAEMTCSTRSCENCFVKRGWDIGVITEDHFEDILEKKRLKILLIILSITLPKAPLNIKANGNNNLHNFE